MKEILMQQEQGEQELTMMAILLEIIIGKNRIRL